MDRADCLGHERRRWSAWWPVLWGSAILWASGVEFLIYPPPGIPILLAGPSSWPWPGGWAGVGAFLGLFVTVGFVVSGAAEPGRPGRNDRGHRHLIQMTGVLTALIAGVIATRTNYRKQAQARQ